MKPIDRLAGAFCSVTDPRIMKRLFTEMFTPAEIDDLVLRWRLMEMLEAGATQRAIAGRLGISLCKITRGSKVLQGRGSITRALIAKQTGESRWKPAEDSPTSRTPPGTSGRTGDASSRSPSPGSSKR